MRRRCDSRVLESALALSLMTRIGAVSPERGLITLSCGTDERSVGRALSWLLEHQDADGGFSGPPDMVGPPARSRTRSRS
jgi:hypothetical protein